MPINRNLCTSLLGGNNLVDSTGQELRIADLGGAARLATHNTGSREFQNMEGMVHILLS